MKKIQLDLTGNVSKQYWITLNENHFKNQQQVERLIILHNTLMSNLYAFRKSLLARKRREDYTFSKKDIDRLIERIDLVDKNTKHIIDQLTVELKKEWREQIQTIRKCYEIDDSFGGTHRTYNIPEGHTLESYKQFQEEKWKKASEDEN